MSIEEIIKKKTDYINERVQLMSLRLQQGMTVPASRFAQDALGECVEVTNKLTSFVLEHHLEGMSEDRRVVPVSVFPIAAGVGVRIEGRLPFKTNRRMTNAVQRVWLDHLEEQVKAIGLQKFSQKMVICYIHYVAEGTTYVDHDNFDTKPFTDCLSLYLLVDDSEKYLSHYMDCREADREYTEIYLVEQSHFAEFLSDMDRKGEQIK